MSRNPFNLWAPTLEPTEIEDVAFSVYAKHTQEREDVINYIVEQIQSGVGESFTIDLDDDFCESDVEYIRKEVLRRLG